MMNWQPYWPNPINRKITEERANRYLKDLEHRIEVMDSVKGTQVCLMKGRVEGTARSYTSRDPLPVAVVVRVDNNRSYVYNLKHLTKTIPVPTEMALATVRFLNGGEHDKQRTD